MDLRLPNITGATDREQLAQIKSYLYQLVPQLQWALRDTGSPLGSNTPTASVSDTAAGLPSGMAAQIIFNAIKPLIAKEYFSADYVIERSVTDGWTWRKWSSGTYEMFGEFILTTTEDATAYGALYYSEAFSIKMPFAVTSVYMAGTSFDRYTPISVTPSDDTESSIGIAVWCSTSFDAGTEIKVRLTVTGTYKAT